MNNPVLKKKTPLDKDLKRLSLLEAVVQETGQRMVKLGFGVAFLVIISIAAFIAFYGLSPKNDYSIYVVAACIIGGYMALNIGANDVANNVGPAVGSKALTLAGALTIATGAFIIIHRLVKPAVAKASETLENRRKAVSTLFTIPLICSAALLSFAHGANDVANAVGPLAAIVDAASTGDISKKVGVPIWVMLVGALGISAGLVLFGPKLIRTVGQQITKLDRARAFCVALSAVITVIIASALGLSVSSTHIAVGGIFGGASFLYL